MVLLVIFMVQVLPSDLLFPQMEVTFSPLKRPLKTPKRVTGKNLGSPFCLDYHGFFFGHPIFHCLDIPLGEVFYDVAASELCCEKSK